MMAAFGALLAPATAGAAVADAAAAKVRRYPVITSVQPMQAAVGDTITIRGRYFKRGRNKNTVVFRRDGSRAVFVKAKLATAKQLQVTVPARLGPFLLVKDGAPVASRFRLRVLAERLGKRFTGDSQSPLISPARPAGAPAPGGTVTPGGGTVPAPVVSAPDADCDGDGMTNAADTDDDNDLLLDTTEQSLGLDPCHVDSDRDGVEDGYEYQSAWDLNDDEYQDPNQIVPYPGKRPYPNPLFKDADVDYDGDSLTLGEEYSLWKRYGTRSLGKLLYSDGEAYSLSARLAGTGRRRPTQSAVNYPQQIAFLNWARGGAGYDPVMLPVAAPWHDPANQQPFAILDTNRDGSISSARTPIDWTLAQPMGYVRSEQYAYDLDNDGWISDDERDEDADGLTNFDETHGRMTAEYWKGCYDREKPYGVSYAGTSVVDPDTDGDGILDGADDQDHDDVPNMMELSRNAASGHVDWDPYKGTCHPNDELLTATPGGGAEPPKTLHPDDWGRVNPFNPCLPDTWSRTCQRHPAIADGTAPFDGSTVWFSLQ